MSHDDLKSDIIEVEEDSLPISSSAATDLAEHSRVVGGVIVEQPVSGTLPLPDKRYAQHMILHDAPQFVS